jgi:hypothetical protein
MPPRRESVPRTPDWWASYFGRHRKCRVKLHWNRKVHGRRLKRGQYLLLLEAYTGRKIIDATDAVAFTERR